MITVITGTNREGAVSQKIADISCKKFGEYQIEYQRIDLIDLPRDIFVPENYGGAPESFAPFQEKILNCDGILTVVPEYNGSFPGALKYFIDLCKFPESLADKPAAFIGVSAGMFGAIRSIEQLEMVFQYRNAHIFGKRVLFPGVSKKLNDDKTAITDEFIDKLHTEMLVEFDQFARAINGYQSSASSKS